MKKLLIGLLLGLIVIVGAVGVGVKMFADSFFEKGLEEAMLQLPPELDLTYEDADLSLLGQNANFKKVNLKLEEQNMTILMDELVVDDMVTSDDPDVPVLMETIRLNNVDMINNETQQTTHVNEVIVRKADALIKQQLAQRGTNATGTNGEFSLPPILDIEMNGIELTADMMDDQDFDPAAYGYEWPIMVDAAVKYTFAESDKDFNLETMNVVAEDMFGFDFDLHMGGINMETLTALQSEDVQDPFALLSLFSEEIKLYNVNLTYTDDSFADKMMEEMAAEEGITVSDMKAEMFVELDNMIDSESNEQSADMMRELRDFIDNPNELRLGINPDEPLTADDFFGVVMGITFGGASPANLIDSLSLTIESN